MKRLRIMIGRLLFIAIVFSLLAPYLHIEGQQSTEGLDMQAARAKMMTERGKKIAYTKKFDLSGLPHYHPAQKVSGTIRLWGSNYITDGFLGGYWEAAFKKYHPDVTFDFDIKTTLAGGSSLICV